MHDLVQKQSVSQPMQVLFTVQSIPLWILWERLSKRYHYHSSTPWKISHLSLKKKWQWRSHSRHWLPRTTTTATSSWSNPLVYFDKLSSMCTTGLKQNISKSSEQRHFNTLHLYRDYDYALACSFSQWMVSLSRMLSECLLLSMIQPIAVLGWKVRINEMTCPLANNHC